MSIYFSAAGAEEPTGLKHGTETRRLRQQQLQHKHNAAASSRNLREARPKPRGRNAYDQRRRTGKWRIRRREDCREGHYGKRHVRHVVEKRPQEPVRDGPTDERERQDSGPQRDRRHHHKVGNNARPHGRHPPLEQAPQSRGPRHPRSRCRRPARPPGRAPPQAPKAPR